MRAYSQDLRQRIVQAVDEGESPEDVATRFAVSVATVYRYLALRRKQGHLEPKPKPGRPRSIPTEAEAALRAQVDGAQDATLAEYCTAWVEAGGTPVSEATMSRMLARLGLPRKKRRFTRVNKIPRRGHNGARKRRS
jgi:transposase